MNLLPRALAVLFCLTWVGPLAAQADTVFLKRGEPLRGRLWEEGDQEVVLNVFRTRVRSVVRGTERVPKKKVKRVAHDKDPHLTFWREAVRLKDGTAAEWAKLAESIASHKRVKGLVRHAWTEVLLRDRDHAAAQKGLGKHLKTLLASDPRFNAALKEKLAAYLATGDFAARETAYKELVKLGETRAFTYLERAVRSSKIPKGRQDKRPLTFRSVETSGTYSLLVPRTYDPLTPTPLVIGLHGGGPAGPNGNLVNGSGESAMGSWFQRHGDRRGWIVACPTANRAPWSRRENDPWIRALVEEMCLSFNVDRNRIYLAGHSMGGYGTWHFGPRYAHLWAAIGPAAGGGRPNLKYLQDTKTGVYCYHGADDGVVGPDRDRRCADEMLRRDQDFVYCEIPVAGHGWPGDARDEMWRYFDVRRLAVAPGRRAKGRFAITQEPLSSFAAKPTKEETRYFGHPGKPPAARDLKTLLADLDAGGGLAIRAVEGLLQLKGKAAASAVAKRLSRKRSQGTRKGAAEVLGAMGEAASAKPLHKVLADDDLVVVGAAARALGGIPSEATPKAWTRCVADLGARFTKRKSGGQWAYPDYERFLSTVGDLVRGTERRKAADGVPALRAVAETFVFPTPRVRTSRRGGQDAERPRRRLARAVVEALAAIGTKDCAPLLKQFAEKPGLGVADEASNALADLKRP